jgi:hypothetical protein
MNPLEIAVLTYLQQHAQGKINAITADNIFAALSPTLPILQGRTQEQIRQSIQALVNNYQHLIGSGSTGYYMINTRDEAISTIMDLVNRSKSNLDRAGVIQDQWNNANPQNQI